MTDERNNKGRPTEEVGDEGGSPGDVELERETIVSGSESTSTVDSVEEATREIHRDETGEGRRSP